MENPMSPGDSPSSHLLQHLSGQVGIQRRQRHGWILKDLQKWRFWQHQVIHRINRTLSRLSIYPGEICRNGHLSIWNSSSPNPGVTMGFFSGLWSKAGFWGSKSRWTRSHTPSPPFYRSGKNFLRRISMLLCHVQTHPNPLSIGSIPAADTVDGYSLVI